MQIKYKRTCIYNLSIIGIFNMTSTFTNNLLSKTSNMISNINSHSFRHSYYIVTILIIINVLINTQNKHITKTHINSNETQSP